MTRFAAEYGHALDSLAREEGLAADFAAQLIEICALLDENQDYLRLLDARNVEASERKRLVDAALGTQAHPHIVRFMKLLIDRGGISYFPECAAAYRKLYDADFGVERAEAVSAVELTEAQQTALKEKLERITGRRIELHCAVDASLIGGVRVDVAGKRYDNTVRARLDGMRAALTAKE